MKQKTKPLERYMKFQPGICTKDYFNHMCGSLGHPCVWHEPEDTLWSLQAACV